MAKRVFSELVKDKAVPDMLKQYRVKAGLSQAAAAEKFGISQQAWGFYETGRNFPKVNFIQAFKKETGIDLMGAVEQVYFLNDPEDAEMSLQVALAATSAENKLLKNKLAQITLEKKNLQVEMEKLLRKLAKKPK